MAFTQFKALQIVFEDVFNVESNYSTGVGGKNIVRVTFVGEEKPTSEEQIGMKDELFSAFDDITFIIPHGEGLCDISSWQK